MSRRATIIAVLLAELLLFPMAFEALWGWPRVALTEIVMPGGVVLPVNRGALHKTHGGDSCPGWVFDVESMQEYDYDALMMAFHRLKRFGKDFNEYRDGVVLQRDTSLAGVPFEYAFGGDSWFRDGQGLTVVMETKLTPEHDQYGVINFTIDIDEAEQIEALLPFFRRARWVPDSLWGQQNVCAFDGPR